MKKFMGTLLVVATIAIVQVAAVDAYKKVKESVSKKKFNKAFRRSVAKIDGKYYRVKIMRPAKEA
jgi:L-ribulose-5-phosphate 3-epimerase UlaE